MDLRKLAEDIKDAAHQVADGDHEAGFQATGLIAEAVTAVEDDEADSQQLLQCLVDTFSADDEEIKGLLELVLLEILPQLMSLAANGPRCCHLAFQLCTVAASCCPAREVITVVLEVLDVHSGDCYDSSLHMLLRDLLLLLPKVLCQVSRRRLACAVECLPPAAALAQAAGEYMSQVAEVHTAAAMELGSMTPQWPASRNVSRSGDVAAAGGFDPPPALAAAMARVNRSSGPTAELHESDVEELVEATVQNVQPFIDFARAMLHQVMEPASSDAVELKEATQQLAVFCLYLHGTLLMPWHLSLLQHPALQGCCQQLLGLLQELGVGSWQQAWEVACGRELHEGSSAGIQTAGAALAALHGLPLAGTQAGHHNSAHEPQRTEGEASSLQGQAGASLQPPGNATDTMQVASLMAHALIHQSSVSSSFAVLDKALGLLTAAGNLASLQLTAAMATTPAACTSTSSTGTSTSTGTGTSTGLPGAEASHGQGPSGAEVSSLSLQQLHDGVASYRPQLSSKEYEMLEAALPVLRIVAINVVHSPKDSQRTAAFRCLRAMLDGLPHTVRACALGALAREPSAELAALMMQRLSKEVAVALGHKAKMQQLQDDPVLSSSGGKALQEEQQQGLPALQGPSVFMSPFTLHTILQLLLGSSVDQLEANEWPSSQLASASDADAICAALNVLRLLLLHYNSPASGQASTLASSAGPAETSIVSATVDMDTWAMHRLLRAVCQHAVLPFRSAVAAMMAQQPAPAAWDATSKAPIPAPSAVHQGTRPEAFSSPVELPDDVALNLAAARVEEVLDRVLELSNL